MVINPGALQGFVEMARQVGRGVMIIIMLRGAESEGAGAERRVFNLLSSCVAKGGGRRSAASVEWQEKREEIG